MRRRQLAGTAPWALLPWTWFLVRDLHPVLDIVALGLPVLVVASVATCAALAWRRRRAAPLVTAASWLAMGLVAVVGPWTPQGSEPPVDGVRVAAVNTYGSRSDADAVADRLELVRPAVVVVSEPNRQLVERLGGRYPTVVRPRGAPEPARSDPVLLTDLPARALELPAGLRTERAVRVRIEGPSGPFVVYGLHLRRPRLGPSGDDQVSVRAHARTVDRLLDAIADEDLPVVVAGDLNLVDRTSGYRALAGPLRDAVRTGWAPPTALRPLGLPFLPRIDHVLVSRRWCAADGTTFRLLGSDHLGVAATVGRCPP